MNDETQNSSGEAPKRLTPAEWEEVKARYEAGTATLQELSSEYGVTKGAISRKFRRDNVVKGSKAADVGKKVAEAAALAAKDAEAERQKRVEETRRQSYQSAQMIHVLTHKLIAEQVNAGKPVEALTGDLKALKVAAEVFEKTKAQRWHILGLDEQGGDDEEPSILIEDLTDEEISELRNMQEQDDGDLMNFNLDDEEEDEEDDDDE